MAAYPFQPMSKKKFKRLCRIMKETNHKVNSHRRQKEFVFPDSVISKTTCPVSYQVCDHPQIDNS